MIGFIIRQIRGPLVLILAAASILYGFFLLQLLPFWSAMAEAQSGRELQATPFFSAERLNAAFAAFDAATRQDALSFYALDVLNALLFALSIAALMGYALRRLNIEASPWRWLLVLPLASGAFDLIENGLLTGLLLTHPGAPAWIATLAGICTGLKAIAGMAAIAIMLILMIIAGARHAWRQLNPAGD
ncbi:MAG: hypothetical protein AB7J28_02835 [Hyphomonadaceae bacterium]